MKNLILTLLLFTVSCLFGQSLPEEYSDFYFDLQMLSSEKRLKNIEKAIESNPEDPWYYWMAASFYEIVDDKHNIVKNFEKAISLDSNFSAGHGSYARYLRTQENPDIQKALFHINKSRKKKTKCLYIYTHIFSRVFTIS
jgi:tetratricopeptide (TPR) repeat protein